MLRGLRASVGSGARVRLGRTLITRFVALGTVPSSSSPCAKKSSHARVPSGDAPKTSPS